MIHFTFQKASQERRRRAAAAATRESSNACEAGESVSQWRVFIGYGRRAGEHAYAAVYVCVCVVERCALFSISFSSLGQKNKNEDSQKRKKTNKNPSWAGQQTHLQPRCRCAFFGQCVRQVSKRREKGREWGRGSCKREGTELLLL